MSISAALDAVLGLAHSALEGLATLLTPAAGGFAAALAIVVLTVAVRLLISPLTWLQARSARRGRASASASPDGAPGGRALRALTRAHRPAVSASIPLSRTAGVRPCPSPPRSTPSSVSRTPPSRVSPPS